MNNNRRFPAEWEEQSGVMLALPHAQSDWAQYLNEILSFYAELIAAITRFERVLLLCQNAQTARQMLSDHGVSCERMRFFECDTNDTWARDFGFLCVENGGVPLLLDFEFNGWGLKFPANLDNQINAKLHAARLFGGVPMQKTGWVFEGGSVESDGAGTLLVTENCLLSDNRQPFKNRAAIEANLARDLGAERILWIQNGHLENDDTDAHIDTLARFCDRETIAFVGCADRDDHHFDALLAMRKELEALRTAKGGGYRLIELPMVEPIFYDGERLPATYANFLIINRAVIAPIYGVSADFKALAALKTAFPMHEIIPINAAIATRQHGSIHCLTMQINKAVGF